MDVSPDLLAQFIGVTNAPETLAAQLLRDSGLDLEAAIQSFFAIQEAGGLPSEAPAPGPPSTSSDDIPSAPAQPPPSAILIPDPPVPAPLPQIVDTLLPSATPHRAPAPLPPDPFLNSDGTEHGDGLAMLFRPPTHLISTAQFEAAMTAGQRQKRWLLVNLQRSDVFACHVMNRDVWSHPPMQVLLQAHFIFWQRDEQAPDGARYKQFYRYAHAPHVALIDPRSGERLRVWGGDGEPVDAKLLLHELSDFVASHSLDDDASIARQGGMSSTRPTPSGPRPSGASAQRDAQMDEDAEIAAAIAASMEQSSLGQGEVDINMHDVDAVPTAEAARPPATAATVTRAAAPNVTPGPSENGVSGRRAGVAGMPPLGAEVEHEASRMLSATDTALNRSRSLRAQQDDEFEESLALDRAKEESEKEEAVRAEREAVAAAKRACKAAEMREAKRGRVPAAPDADCKECVTELAIRLPSGARLQRRFLARHNVGNVYDFVESECEELSERSFELMAAYPKKRFVDRGALLEELAPKAALVVHLKD